jgi:hypothetical protein
MTASGINSDAFSRREIDMALGILMGLRKCSERQAFNEIASAVYEVGIGLPSICRALVELASGTAPSFSHRSEVTRLWGDLIDRRTDPCVPAV